LEGLVSLWFYPHFYETSKKGLKGNGHPRMLGAFYYLIFLKIYDIIYIERKKERTKNGGA
jgi:hypothetical protein